jgi:hypothetical protein
LGGWMSILVGWLLHGHSGVAVSDRSPPCAGQPVRLPEASVPNMPARGAFQPLVLENRVVLVSGGLSERPAVLETREVLSETFVKVSKETDWVCTAVSGLSWREHPLARTNIIEKMRHTIATSSGPSSAVAEQDVMNGFDYEGVPESASAVACSRRCTRRKSCGLDVLTLTMPQKCKEKYPGDANTVDVKVGNDGKQLWVEQGGLLWLITYLKDQLETRCVEQPPKKMKHENPSGVYWSFRDESWQACARTADGSTHRREMSVKKRLKAMGGDASGVTYEEAKLAVENELAAWVASLQGH